MNDVTLLDQKFLLFSDDMKTFGDFEIITEIGRKRNIMIELGTAKGMGAILLSSCRPDKIYTIDIFEKFELIADKDQREGYEAWWENKGCSYLTIKNYLSMWKNIEVIQGLSFAAATKFNNESIDLLFIDADHSYEGVKRDYYSWFCKVKKNGIILLHDCDIRHPAVFQFYNIDIQGEIQNNKVKLIDFKTENYSNIKILEKL